MFGAVLKVALGAKLPRMHSAFVDRSLTGTPSAGRLQAGVQMPLSEDTLSPCPDPALMLPHICVHSHIRVPPHQVHALTRASLHTCVCTTCLCVCLHICVHTLALHALQSRALLMAACDTEDSSVLLSQ